jgi:hypothetical protein
MQQGHVFPPSFLPDLLTSTLRDDLIICFASRMKHSLQLMSAYILYESFK